MGLTGKHTHTKATFNWLKEAFGCWDALIAVSMTVDLTSTDVLEQTCPPSSPTGPPDHWVRIRRYISCHVEAGCIIDWFLYVSSRNRCQVEEVVMSAAFFHHFHQCKSILCCWRFFDVEVYWSSQTAVQFSPFQLTFDTYSRPTCTYEYI